jgi:hypothetical protein
MLDRHEGWRVLAHVRIDPPPTDWRDQLARQLGERPRRIGPWAELALYGARACLDAAQEDRLPSNVSLRVASLTATCATVKTVAEQARAGVPMPFTFMQSQPSQTLAALSRHLGWQGDARFIAARSREAVLQLALAESGSDGLMLGWVEEDRCSEWWRLVQAT